MRFNTGLVIAGLVLAGSNAAMKAQTGEVHEMAMAMAPQSNTFRFIATQAGLEHQVVKNAPYSAESITETTRILADGTRIERQTTSRFCRDSDGRTRREHTLDMIGPWSSAGEAPATIIINDPVAGEMFILNPADNTARRISVVEHSEHGEHLPAIEEGAEHGGPHQIVLALKTKMKGGALLTGEHDFTAMARHAKSSHVEAAVEKESLGERTIEGVVTEGTRITKTIPAGQMGNDRPITIVTERWYSPELQAVVLSDTKDPMSGDVIYRLANIQRGDPSPSMFQLPPGYTISGEGSIHRKIIKRKEVK